MSKHIYDRITDIHRTKKRPVVAYLTGNIHSDHPTGIVRRLYKLFGTEDIDVRYYLGTECSMFLDGIKLEESVYDYQYLSLYEYTAFDDVDVLIVGFGTISIYHGGGSVSAFLSRMPKVPCIILENDSRIDGTVYIMVDNYRGMRQVVEHLIREHGCRRIAYVSGPVHNEEARRRLLAYRDVLREHGIEADEKLIGYGDFSEHSDEVVEEILQRAGEKPDAIVSANDEMCEGIYRVLKSHGYEIGRDIKVTGFDDTEKAPFMEPPLTTAAQNLDRYTELALEKTKQYLRGETPVSGYITPELVIRESCGCDGSSPALLQGSRRDEHRSAGEIVPLHMNHQKTWIGSLILRELLIESVDSGSFFEKLGMEMSYLNAEASVLCLAREPMLLPPGRGAHEEPVIDLPEELVIPMLQTDNRFTSWPLERAPSIKRHELGDVLSGERAGQSLVFLLFYEQYQYGALYVMTSPENIPFFYMLSMEIGTGLRYLFMSLERKAIREMLEAQNDRLLYSASHDGLTNLLNRNGLIEEMGEFILSRPGTWMVSVMADLDHLKQINDTYGHREGDSAIRTAADILRQAIGPDGIVGRSGGDEFMAILLLDGEEAALREKVKAMCDAYNATSGKPYYVEISVGCSAFIDPSAISVRTLFQKADEDLYRDKLGRRESVVKAE